MGQTPVIETERLRLRPFTEADAPALFTILRDPEVNTFLPMFPPETVQQAAGWLREHCLEASGYYYAICLKPDPTPIGYVNVSGDESHDLGYALRKESWGQGIVAEACRALIENLSAWDVPYLTATHDVKNPRSGAVMKKLGMTYRYSYEEQWQPKNIPVTFRMYQINLDGQENRVFQRYWDKYAVHFIEKDL